MSYVGNSSDVEQEKNMTDFRNNNRGKRDQKLSEVLWNDKRRDHDDSDSEMSESENFLAKGAFLLTPSHELSMERAALICEKMNFKGCFSLTKTATGILFKFSSPEDYQAVLKKGYHKVTGARFYRKVPIPCRPQKTFTLYVFDIPEDVPVEDVRHSLYRFSSVVEIVRVQVQLPGELKSSGEGTSTPKAQNMKMAKEDDIAIAANKETPPAPIRITLASLDEYNVLLQNGLNFYGATFFPTETNLPYVGAKVALKKGRVVDGSVPGRVRELLPVFDAASFCKIPPPTSKTIKPRP